MRRLRFKPTVEEHNEYVSAFDAEVQRIKTANNELALADKLVEKRYRELKLTTRQYNLLKQATNPNF